MVIYDAMQMIEARSHDLHGWAASMGSILLVEKKGRRFIFRTGEVMIHQPSGGGQGTSADPKFMAETDKQNQGTGPPGY
jgi:ATP-dependent Clp protease protease subunit